MVFCDLDDIREYFGTPNEPGQTYQTMQCAMDVWAELGVLKVDLEPTDGCKEE